MSSVEESEGKRKHSGDSGETPETKNARHGGTPTSSSVIDSIREANTVLLDDSITELCESMSSTVQDSVFVVSEPEKVGEQVSVSSPDMPTPSASSSDKTSESSQILSYLRKIDDRLKNVDGRLESVEKKLQKLDTLDKKVDSIDKDMSKLWGFVQDNFKTSEERMNKCDDNIDELRFELGLARESIDNLTKEHTKLDEEHAKLTGELDYMRSQSMRNNLIFGNIPEYKNEKPTVTEAKVRDLLVSNMGIPKDTVDSISIERAHRATLPPQGLSDSDFTYDESLSNKSPRQFGPPRKPRTIIVKFASFKDRELIRNSSRNLKGTPYYIHEQFPKSVTEKRRNLLPQMKAAQQNGQKAWLSYDKLYIDGVLQSDGTSAAIAPQDHGRGRGRGRDSRRGYGGGRGRGGNRGGGRGNGQRDRHSGVDSC